VADCCHPQGVTGVQNSVEAAIIITDKNTSNTTSTPETTTVASSSSSCVERFQESLLFSTF
jgi:4-hydroxy-3-methylbut-2-enyl diphosphate reductase IspH